MKQKDIDGYFLEKPIKIGKKLFESKIIDFVCLPQIEARIFVLGGTYVDKKLILPAYLYVTNERSSRIKMMHTDKISLEEYINLLDFEKRSVQLSVEKSGGLLLPWRMKGEYWKKEDMVSIQPEILPPLDIHLVLK